MIETVKHSIAIVIVNVLRACFLHSYADRFDTWMQG